MSALPKKWKETLEDTSARDDLMSLLTALFNFTRDHAARDMISELTFCLIRELSHYEILFEICHKDGNGDKFLENTRYMALQILSNILYVRGTGVFLSNANRKMAEHFFFANVTKCIKSLEAGPAGIREIDVAASVAMMDCLNNYMVDELFLAYSFVSVGADITEHIRTLFEHCCRLLVAFDDLSNSLKKQSLQLLDKTCHAIRVVTQDSTLVLNCFPTLVKVFALFFDNEAVFT